MQGQETYFNNKKNQGFCMKLESVEFPLCISFLYWNSLCILWLHLLWCLFLLHFRYSKISVENKTRARLQDEQNWDQ